VDLRPDQAVRRNQRGLSQLTGFRSRLDRRPGAAGCYPAAFVDALAARIAATEPKGAARLVAIDGWGCGGKTALAEALLDRLEPAWQYVSTDEFFTGFERQTDPGPVAHLRWRELQDAVAGLARTGLASVRGYDWEHARILGPERLAGGSWLIDGLFSHHRDLRGAYDLTIWVQGRMEGRLDRVARRDGAHMLPHWRRDWLPREAAYMRQARPWETADIIVAGADLPIGALAAWKEGLL